MEPDCLLKELGLGLAPRRRYFLLAPPTRVANRHLLNYWKPLIRVFEGKFSCYVLASMSRWWLMRYDISHYMLATDRGHAAYRLYAQWGDRPPVLSLSQADDAWCTQALRDAGLPDGAWFACIHVREPGFSPVDEELHAHRNGSIEAAIPAMREITRRGGWVVRIGDPTMRKLPPMPHVIDYAHSPMKCERLDVALCAKARFILGNTSGIALVGTVFGVPCAIANAIPVSTLWFRQNDLSIPKLLWSESLHRHLRFDESMALPLAEYRYAQLYKEENIRVDENSAEDILDLVNEMLDRMENHFSESVADMARMDIFRSLFRACHSSFGARGRIGTLFLRRHADLLPDTNSGINQRA